MQKITPFLWFDKQAEEAADFYVSVFEDSQIVKKSRYGKEGAKASGMKEGMVMTVEFELNGQKFVGLNGGPHFKFSEAVSFVVNCETQKEVDYFWSKLSVGGKEEQCGWLKDKFGVSWQIVPTSLGKMLSGSSESSKRVMTEMLKMKKIDVDKLRLVYEG